LSWVGADLSESTSVSEGNLAIRLLTDLSIVTSSVAVKEEGRRTHRLDGRATLDFSALMRMYADCGRGLTVTI